MRSLIFCSLLFSAVMLSLSVPSSAQIGVSVNIAPPALLTYDQPMCPGDGYIWTPGYWAWDGEYYWISGEWVMPPEAGDLWTPGYWSSGGDGFLFNEGYWGTSIGFYGGINYGFGYFGNGYDGGRWNHGHFYYNSSVNNINRNAEHNNYNARANESNTSHVSYNGGNGGTSARASSREEATSRDRHFAPVAAQTEHAQTARNDPQQRFTANRGVSPSRPSAAVHPNDLPAIDHPASPNTGNAKTDQKYQKQQDNLVAKQNQQRQKLQGHQDRQHQQMRSQQQEQRHQQQTQQMQQRHTQQTQRMAQRQSSGGGQSRGGGSHGGGGGGGRR
jgi:hypothetical protein